MIARGPRGKLPAMKAPRSLLFIALVLVVSAWARADVPPPNTWPETCVGSSAGARCTMEGGFEGKCVWLTHRERQAFGVRSRARCPREGPRAGQCLTCMSLAFRPGPSKTPDAGKDASKPAKPEK